MTTNKDHDAHRRGVKGDREVDTWREGAKITKAFRAKQEKQKRQDEQDKKGKGK